MISLKQTGAQAIVECVKREGVTKVFCVPGESYLPLLDALHDESSIQVISCRHESGAAFMAEGYGKSSLIPGVVLATRGVGAANLAIGVHTAYQDSTPMVVMLGQVHSKFRGREGFQEVDLDRWFQHIAKWAVEITDSERIPEIVQRAFRVAQSGRPGPVVISLPEDVLPVAAEMQFGPHFIKPTPAPAKQEVVEVEHLLAHAKHPLIIAGGGVKASQAEEALQAFAKGYQIPVMAAFRRQDAFPNDHPMYVGHLGLATNKKVLQTVQEADVILALGTRLSEVTTQDYSIMDPDKKLIHIDIDDESIGKVYQPAIGIVADLREALTSLQTIKLPMRPWKGWVNERRQAYESISRLIVTPNDHLNKHIIATLANRLPNDALLTNDAGNFAGWLHAFYPFTQKHTYVGPTSGAMGYGMPAALGAKLAFPEKTAVSLSGDGGFMMTVQELETAVRNQIPVISIVFNNNMYGTIRMHQEIHYPTKVMATDLGQVSFADLAKSVGANGYCVRSAEEFANVFAKVLASQQTKPTVIEIITDQEQISVSATIQELRDR
ncbi:thiamine pyrophosphate-binding protein [Lentibacillus sp. N15]|uniref:thiamine pyrophosphate-binding protein n=1 Tax=Lentibacillus songyuanensis TaxID=3136161 RepID=UPI0031BA9B8C